MIRVCGPLTSENAIGCFERLSERIRLSPALHDYLCRIRAEVRCSRLPPVARLHCRCRRKRDHEMVCSLSGWRWGSKAAIRRRPSGTLIGTSWSTSAPIPLMGSGSKPSGKLLTDR